jgi:hypothetical protein
MVEYPYSRPDPLVVSETVAEIFKNKKARHQQQARLPIEEKVRILVELQKIALTIRPRKTEGDQRRVWQLQ